MEKVAFEPQEEKYLKQEEKYLKQATKWLKKILVNWDSYEPLNWSQVIIVDYPPHKSIVSHEFIHKNEQGIRERCAITLYMDNPGNVVKFNKWEQTNL